MSHNTAGYCEELTMKVGSSPPVTKPAVKTPLITDDLFVTLAKPTVMQVWSRL
jgi:hypothetical protein